MIDNKFQMNTKVFGNPLAEDLFRCCDCLNARIHELKEALVWTSAALQSSANRKTRVRESDAVIYGSTRKSISEILDEADRALLGDKYGTEGRSDGS